jgi:hypothetical protein
MCADWLRTHSGFKVARWRQWKSSCIVVGRYPALRSVGFVGAVTGSSYGVHLPLYSHQTLCRTPPADRGLRTRGVELITQNMESLILNCCEKWLDVDLNVKCRSFEPRVQVHSASNSCYFALEFSCFDPRNWVSWPSHSSDSCDGNAEYFKCKSRPRSQCRQKC